MKPTQKFLLKESASFFCTLGGTKATFFIIFFFFFGDEA